MHKVLFGDNQFFGVNHMSEEKARQQSMRFRDAASMIRVIDNAYSAGIKVFMCTTHDAIEKICDHIRTNPQKYPDFEFYPCLPYAHKYNDAVTEDGLIRALQKFIGGNAFDFAVRGGMALTQTDLIGMMKILVDAELRMFKGLKIPVIFLQNVLTDLLLGLGFKTVIKEFAEYIQQRYQAEPGFITMNLPMLVPILEECGIKNPIVCTNINKIGFRMCGGKEVYEQIISSKKIRCIAMSIFASGAISPEEAIEYVCQLDGVESVVFGASSAGHIYGTLKMIESHWGKG